MLLDGRPLVVPRDRRAEAGCNLAGHRLPPGHHTLHTSYQVSGYSPYVAISYASQSCTFAAASGRRYLAKRECAVTDTTTGEVVSHMSARSPLDAYFEVVRAYAACGDSLGIRELNGIRGSGQLSRPPQDWVIGKCDAWADLR